MLRAELRAPFTSARNARAERPRATQGQAVCVYSPEPYTCDLPLVHPRAQRRALEHTPPLPPPRALRRNTAAAPAPAQGGGVARHKGTQNRSGAGVRCGRCGAAAQRVEIVSTNRLGARRAQGPGKDAVVAATCVLRSDEAEEAPPPPPLCAFDAPPPLSHASGLRASRRLSYSSSISLSNVHVLGRAPLFTYAHRDTC